MEFVVPSTATTDYYQEESSRTIGLKNTFKGGKKE